MFYSAELQTVYIGIPLEQITRMWYHWAVIQDFSPEGGFFLRFTVLPIRGNYAPAERDRVCMEGLL